MEIAQRTCKILNAPLFSFYIVYIISEFRRPRNVVIQNRKQKCVFFFRRSTGNQTSSVPPPSLTLFTRTKENFSVFFFFFFQNQEKFISHKCYFQVTIERNREEENFFFHCTCIHLLNYTFFLKSDSHLTKKLTLFSSMKVLQKWWKMPFI